MIKKINNLAEWKGFQPDHVTLSVLRLIGLEPTTYGEVRLCFFSNKIFYVFLVCIGLPLRQMDRNRWVGQFLVLGD